MCSEQVWDVGGNSGVNCSVTVPDSQRRKGVIGSMWKIGPLPASRPAGGTSNPLDAIHRAFFATIASSRLAWHSGALRRYFDWWHRQPDPWSHAVDPEERRKYRVTLDHLSTMQYRRILDVGCSEGVLTRMVSQEYPDGEVLGVDIAARAIRRASRSSGRNLRFACLDILTQTPPGHFDLVLCSEMLYYFGRGERLRLVTECLRQPVRPGGQLVLVHPWPEARQLYRYLDADPRLRMVGEHVEHGVRRPFAVTRYEAT